MLYHLFGPLKDVVSGFRLFDYITFRAAFASVLAFLVCTVVGPGIVESLRRCKIAGYSRTGSEHVDLRRGSKADVPTMGGVILLVGVGLSGFLFARLDTPYTWITLLAFLAFGALGAVDDRRKLSGDAAGLSERTKLTGQLAIAFVAITGLYAVGHAEAARLAERRAAAEGPGAAAAPSWLRAPAWKPSPYQREAVGWVRRHVVHEGDTYESLAARYLWNRTRGAEIARLNGHVERDGSLIPLHEGQEIRLPAAWPDPYDLHRADLQVPLVKGFCLDLGLLFIPLGILVIVGASNAVNITDGMDGLAIGITASVAGAFVVIAYVVGRVDFSRELYLFYVPEGGEVAVIAAALAGGSLGFLWFNAHPAEVFMGDTGSLSIGGILGVMAVTLRHEVTLAIAGGMFVAEVLSVLVQRSYFKATRRAARRRGEPDATGKRWFRVAPFHHHYEAGGLHENKVTVRFWIVSVICVVAALASLKLR